MKPTLELRGVTGLLNTLSRCPMSKCPRCGSPLEHCKAGDLGYNVALLLPVQTGANGSYVVTPEEKAADNGELRAQGEASWTSLRRTSVRYCP
jgi:hypothetical protein